MEVFEEVLKLLCFVKEHRVYESGLKLGSQLAEELVLCEVEASGLADRLLDVPLAIPKNVVLQVSVRNSSTDLEEEVLDLV